jgi:hypothetical protein
MYISTHFFSQIGCECEDVFDSLAELMHWPFVHVLLVVRSSRILVLVLAEPFLLVCHLDPLKTIGKET